MFLQNFYDWKKSLNLGPSGTFEGLHRESRNTSLTSLIFDGGKADLAKGLSPNFQVSHAFTSGSSFQAPTYHFGAVWVDQKTNLLHGLIDTNGVFQGKINYGLFGGWTFKAQSQISKEKGHSMIQVEGDWQGADSAFNIRLINPDLTDYSGISTISWLQSVSSSMAAGVEIVAQRVPSQLLSPKSGHSRASPIETGLNFALKYKTGDSISTLLIQQAAAIQASYYHRVTDRVELGSELQLLLAGPRKDAVCSSSVKFDYRQSTIRAQVDSQAKVSLLYEEKLFPGFSVLFAGELDHFRDSSRFGIGISLEN